MNWRRPVLLFLAVYYALLSGCTNKPFVLPDSYHQAIRAASKTISQQIAPELQRLQQPWQTRQIVVGNLINAQTAEMTTSGYDLHAMLLIDLRQELPKMKVSELSPDVPLDDAIALQGITQYVPNRSSADAPSWFKVTITATDLHAQRKIGEASVFINARQFNAIPSRFYRDAPMYLTGTRHKERLTAVAGFGSQLRSILRIDSLLADAVGDYEKGDYTQSGNKFNEIIAQSDENNLIALSGLYQSLFKQKKLTKAEQVFGRLVKSTITEHNLSVKFLFRVRSREFRDDGDLEEQYAIWIRQIARQVRASGLCLEINGHASKSGSAEFNDRLSLQRAQWILEKLTQVEQGLASRLKARGMGFRKNIIGSGSDNALDAIDRRVDFKLTSCQK